MMLMCGQSNDNDIPEFCSLYTGIPIYYIILLLIIIHWSTLHYTVQYFTQIRHRLKPYKNSKPLLVVMTG